MPAKNSIKDYIPNAYYHVYNRGVAQQNIFLDEQDYKIFLYYLKLYLSAPSLQGQTLQVSPSKLIKNFSEELYLHAYCLMPNHFHLFLFQKEADSMSRFLKYLITKFSMYFNRKYKRVGHLFQGRYKAVLVTNENQFVYLSKYIHRNPIDCQPKGALLENYKYSSYQNYLGMFKQIWLQTDEILSYFRKTNPQESYKKFITETDESDIIRLKNITLDL